MLDRSSLCWCQQLGPWHVLVDMRQLLLHLLFDVTMAGLNLGFQVVDPNVNRMELCSEMICYNILSCGHRVTIGFAPFVIRLTPVGHGPDQQSSCASLTFFTGQAGIWCVATAGSKHPQDMANPGVSATFEEAGKPLLMAGQTCSARSGMSTLFEFTLNCSIHTKQATSQCITCGCSGLMCRVEALPPLCNAPICL